MSNECIINISVEVDCIFTIKLDSQVSSTGYSWALAHMPDSVNLLDISFETSQSHIVGCRETQVFTFVALAEDVNNIDFNLLRAFEPENIVAQQKYIITIEPKKDAANELQNTAGCKKFASFGDTCSLNGITIMYMSPIQQCGCENDCTTNALYMGLPVMKYMGPPVMKYMGPPVIKYMGPPVLKYMAPVEVKDDNEKS